MLYFSNVHYIVGCVAGFFDSDVRFAFADSKIRLLMLVVQEDGEQEEDEEEEKNEAASCKDPDGLF